MVDRREQYRPLASRTMENYQVQYLARKYDFGKESRIARLLVQTINETMSREDDSVRIERVHPFELFITLKREKIRLPLFRQEYLEPIYAGGTFAASRELVTETCFERLCTAIPDASKRDLLGLIDPWALVRGKGPSRYTDQLQLETRPYHEQATEKWQKMIDQIMPVPLAERMQTPDLSAPESTVKELASNVSIETGLGARISRHLVEEVITLRNICCPRTSSLLNGQMPLLTTHVNAHLSEELATEFRRHAPVVVTVWTPEELRDTPQTVDKYLELLKTRIIRVCFEAYRQDGLLSLMELQWIFQMSSTRISELIRSFQKEHNIIVPTPGTVLDAGRSMTHKDIIVSLHLQGYNITEISRITHHSPRAVDNYIGTFESVLILSLFSVPDLLMARLLNKGISLIREYLGLIHESYEDENAIRKYLQLKGVSI